MPVMVYRWRYQNSSGVDVRGPEVAFTDQQEAEDWLGGAWRELLDGGVDAVTLLHGSSEVYGPMSLSPEDS